jgi:hypothetical protein
MREGRGAGSNFKSRKKGKGVWALLEEKQARSERMSEPWRR